MLTTPVRDCRRAFCAECPPSVVGMGLLTVVLLAYAPLSSAGFVYEDTNWQQALGLNTGWSLTQTATLFGGTNAAAFHYGNLLIHILNGALLGWSINAVWGQRIAWLTAGIFLLHPLNSEAVSYIAARSELLSTCWILLAIGIGVTFHSREWLRASLIVGCTIAAMLEKSSAVVALGLIPMAVIIAGQARLWAWLAPLWALLVFLMIGRALNIWHSPYSFESEWGVWRYIGIQSYAVLVMLKDVFVPTGLSIDPDWQAISPTTALISGLSLAGAGLLAVWHSAKWPLWSAALLWIGLCLLPRFLVRAPEMLHFHHFYLPMIGISVALSYVINLELEMACEKRLAF